jgi:hypothetical protein
MNAISRLQYVFPAFLFMFLGMSIGMSKTIAETNESKAVEHGRYLVKITGCNDCHTEGYLRSEGTTPEEQWLMGDTFGWRGSWGTTYGSNLRILVENLTEDQWVTYAKNLKARPTMSWFALNAMKNEDLRAIYKFIRYLGPGGKPAPSYVPPDKEPVPPYAQFPSPPPSK